MIKKFRWRKNGGSWNYEDQNLPFNLASVTLADSVDVEPIGGTVSSAAGIPAWDGNLFVAPTSVAIEDVTSTSNFDSRYTSQRLTWIASAFGAVRLSRNPLTALAGDQATLDADVAMIKYAIDKCRAAGLKVILTMHPGSDATWGLGPIVADYPSGAKWLRYIEVAKQFLKLAGQYSNQHVAFEMFNETSMTVGAGWPVRAKALFTALRTVNKNTMILVSGANYASADATNTTGLDELVASDFDGNTGFVVHNYEPFIYTHQGLAGYAGAVFSRLNWPVVPSEEAAVEAGLSGADLARSQYFFNAAQDGPSSRRIDTNVNRVDTWCTAQNVAGTRIFVTEMGVHGDDGGALPGATRVSRAVHRLQTSIRHQAKGHNVTVFSVYSANVWNIADNTSGLLDDVQLAALGRPAINTFDTAASAALARMTAGTTGNNRLTALINAMFLLLKDTGVFSKIDLLVIPAIYRAALTNKADAMLNVMSTAYSATTEQAGGSWVDNRGYASGGASGYLNTQYAPGVSAGVGAQSDCHLGYFQTEAGTNTNYVVGNGNGNSIGLRVGQLTSGLFNSAQAVNFRSTWKIDDTAVLASRIASDGYSHYIDGSLPLNAAGSAFLGKNAVAAAVAPNSNTIKIGRVSSDATSRVGIMSAGSGLTDAQARDLSFIYRYVMDGLQRA